MLHSLLCGWDSMSVSTNWTWSIKLFNLWSCFLLSVFLPQTLASLQRLSTALNILEKYGCNLTNPNRPKYWRTVKHNNPVFRATVDAIQVTTHTRYSIVKKRTREFERICNNTIQKHLYVQASRHIEWCRNMFYTRVAFSTLFLCVFISCLV